MSSFIHSFALAEWAFALGVRRTLVGDGRQRAMRDGTVAVISCNEWEGNLETLDCNQINVLNFQSSNEPSRIGIELFS